MFNEKYAHRASASKTMSLAYSTLAKSIKTRFKPKSILEIGSNDGVFIKHFKKIKNFQNRGMMKPKKQKRPKKTEKKQNGRGHHQKE